MDSAEQPAPPPGGVVVDLAHADAGMLPDVGGKAANLGVLLAAGFPVPDGFCVSTAAYRQAAAAAGLDPVLDALRASSAGPGADAGPAAAAEEEPDLAGLAERMRTSLEATPLPDGIAEAVLAAYARLGEDTPVAVRSSSTAEDLPEASFAGQLDTYLNVIGPDALLTAVRRCWASLWTERAVAYRTDHGIAQHAVGIAVVVQKMVDAAVSGVLFTANPLTGRRQETVVNAAPGLGEALVSGAVNPDQYRVDAATGDILERRLGDKRIEIRATPGGGTRRLQLPDGLRQASLTDEQVHALARLGARAEKLYGGPQDLEWAIEADGEIWVVQSRPITTLYPLPEPYGRDDGARVYLCASLLQGLTRPVTPMGMASVDLMAGGNRTAWTSDGEAVYRFAQVGMRIYLDVTPLLRSKGGRSGILRLMKAADARSVDVLRHVAADPRFSLIKESRLASLKTTFRAFPQLRMLPHVLRAMANPTAAMERAGASRREFERMLELPEPASSARRLDFVERVLAKDITSVLIRELPSPAAGYIWLGLARLALGRLVQPGDLQTVLRGLPHNVTTEMDLDLWRTARVIRDDPQSVRTLTEEDPQLLARRYLEGALPAVCQRELRAFLATYGHRSVAEIDLGVPRWSEDPAHIINVLANYLKLTDPELAPDRVFKRAAETAEAKAAELAARARGKSRLRGRIVAHGLRRARATAGMRESPKFRLIATFAALRRQLRLVGEELADAGRITAPDDIFFLDFAEARVGLRGADLRGPVAERRRNYQREMRRRHIPRLLLSDGTDAEAAMAAQTRAASPADGQLRPGTLAGAPASAGTVTGKARVVLDPASAQLEPGEILVAPSTDPGWTPLFMTAGALVMEMGGPISHGAVVAREYGIPAVVGVPDATTRIKTGDILSVDGAAGTIVMETSADRSAT
ncbi:PEP/pyruvate-binding domain-containing protein [Arthrobacter sp. NPDC089319]|uniref:PEP/pyruvate-binding domain-containing protein n=1 Tax=Arthrobacter sp. NPDC089319 TaxID=3155915 RepID=UPI003438174B